MTPTLQEAIKGDIPLVLDYDEATFAIGDLFTGKLNGKPGFAWTASGWGLDSGPPCHALQADLHHREPLVWEDRRRRIVVYAPNPLSQEGSANKAAIEQWHQIGSGGDRTQRRADALEVILIYNPTFEPDPEP